MNDTIMTKILYLVLAIMIISTIFVPAKKKIEEITAKAAINVITSDERFDIN